MFITAWEVSVNLSARPLRVQSMVPCEEESVWEPVRRQIGAKRADLELQSCQGSLQQWQEQWQAEEQEQVSGMFRTNLIMKYSWVFLGI